MQLRSIDKTHPGAKEEIEKKGLSVCRNEHGVRQSIDTRFFYKNIAYKNVRLEKLKN